jgi:uncharacterized membrane protein YbhN (UPF0104 family)
MRKAERINFFKAYRGVLTGVTFGMVTPFSIGDYLGRILQLSDPERVKVVGAIFLGRISQFLITLFLGVAAIIFFIIKVNDEPPHIPALAIFSTVFLLLLILTFVYRRQVMSFIQRNSFLRPLYRYFEILNKYSPEDIFRVVLYSFLRYMVFSLQFVLLLIMFEVSKDIVLLFMGVAFVFLVKSIIPTILDLGVREAFAIYFFTSLGITSEYNIISASLSLWTINILIPALIGLLLVFKIKLFTK